MFELIDTIGTLRSVLSMGIFGFRYDKKIRDSFRKYEIISKVRKNIRKHVRQLQHKKIKIQKFTVGFENHP